LKLDPNLRLDELLHRAGIDALICRLPEHVVYLSGVYPVLGISAVLYMPGFGPSLLQPAFEEIWLQEPNRMKVFPTGHLGDPSQEESYRQWLEEMKEVMPSGIHKIGVEMSVGIAAPAYNASEGLLPNATWIHILQSAFPESELVDAIPLLEESRSIKSPIEIELLRRANKIANFGLETLRCVIQPGLSEVEAAAMVESAIRIKGTGFDGAQLVQAFAQVTAGSKGTYRQSMLTPSSQYKIQNSDLVMIELGVCADGYWSDLTRVYCAGTPSIEQKRIYNSVLSAQRAAVNALRPGSKWGDPDRAARQVLVDAGLGDYFKHGTGHGIGCRYHERYPQLGPNRAEILSAGMVTSVEPGVYIPGFGGIRIEDNLAITYGKAEWLSNPVEPW
jgi:Xaa-Pro dipeptidase